MAIIAGKGTASSSNLGSSGIGRDFLDTKYTVTESADLTDFDVNLVLTSTVRLKVWRINGSDYDFVGQSQTFSSVSSGIQNLVLSSPIAVIAGDVIDVWISSGSVGVDADDAGTIVYASNVDYITNQPQTNFPSSLAFALSIVVNGTLAGGNQINITSISDHECLQRNGSSQAVFTVSGTITGAATTVEYRLDAGAWAELDASPGTTFTGNVTVTNQQDISVRFSNEIGVVDTVIKITAAACIAAWGQSNEAGRGTNNQTVTVGGGNPTPIVYKSGVFSVLTDPVGTDGSAAGSTWARIAQQYSDAGVPICVGNVAVGATKLSAWQPATANYIKITDFADAMGGLEFSTCVIGEEDSSAGTAQATVESEMEAIINALFVAYGTDNFITNIPIGDGGAWTDTVVKAAYANIVSSNGNAKSGGDLSVIDIDIATTAGNDGIHLKSNADLTTAANIRYNAFVLVTSALNLTITGIPDGSFMTVLDEADGVRVQRQSETYLSEVLSIVVPVAVGTTIKGYVDDVSNPSANGAYLEGITE